MREGFSSSAAIIMTGSSKAITFDICLTLRAILLLSRMTREAPKVLWKSLGRVSLSCSASFRISKVATLYFSTAN